MATSQLVTSLSAAHENLSRLEKFEHELDTTGTLYVGMTAGSGQIMLELDLCDPEVHAVCEAVKKCLENRRKALLKLAENQINADQCCVTSIRESNET